MEITDVKIRKIMTEGRLRAVVSVTIDDMFAVHDIKVVQGDERLFVAMPSRKDENGVYHDIEGYIVEDFGFPLCSRLSANMKGIFHEYPDAPKYAAIDLGIYKEN